MANTYDWRINQLDAKIKQDELDEVIYTVHWTFMATDDSEEPITVSSIGTLDVTYDPEGDFIPYADLTKEDVVSWLEAGLDVDAMKQGLDKQIDLKKNPEDVKLRPNWDAVTEEIIEEPTEDEVVEEEETNEETAE
jgi:hypothetical protein